MWKLRNQQGPNYESLYGREGQLSIFIREIIWFIYMLDKSCHDVLRMEGEGKYSGLGVKWRHSVMSDSLRSHGL